MGDAQAPYVNAARSGNKSFLDENSSAMDRISSKISNSKIVHMISFPIESQGDVVGVLQIHADKETFSPQIVNRVEDFIARLSVIFKLVRDVITSYSIHYTKLYEILCSLSVRLGYFISPFLRCLFHSLMVKDVPRSILPARYAFIILSQANALV